jgi:hypothetical protein
MKCLSIVSIHLNFETSSDYLLHLVDLVGDCGFKSCWHRAYLVSSNIISTSIPIYWVACQITSLKIYLLNVLRVWEYCTEFRIPCLNSLLVMLNLYFKIEHIQSLRMVMTVFQFYRSCLSRITGWQLFRKFLITPVKWNESDYQLFCSQTKQIIPHVQQE